MKPRLLTTTGIAFTLLAGHLAHAEEPDPSIAGLEKAAENFVVAFNQRDAEALAGLFTKDGEIIDAGGEEITTGREAIQARYEEMFEEEDLPLAAVEVASVRLVTPNLAIEDGTVHFTPEGKTSPTRSIKYTAALVKDDAGEWQIGSTRDLSDVTETGAQLTGLAEDIIGDWTCQNDAIDIRLAFEWDPSGTFILGEMVINAPDSPPQTGTSRIAWDLARKTITWWNFDDAGGFSKGDWTPIEKGWFIRAEGTTADGETRTSNQRLTFEDENTIVWKATDRIIDGEMLEDRELRIIRSEMDSEPSAE